MTLEEYIEEKRKRVVNMTLSQARDLIAKTLSHSDMEIEFDKAVWMLLECADEKINSGWIPVIEKLPEEDITVLVTMVKGRHKVMYAKYDGQLQKFCVGNYIRSKYVTAWMPLPQPYKAESEE